MTASFTHDRPGTPAESWRLRSADVVPARLLLDDAAEALARVVVVASHPDDETLGAGGLMATASSLGVAVELVVLTDGEGSHPSSPTHRPDQLAALRRGESARAAQCLVPGLEPVALGLPDGQVAAHHELVVRRLVDLVGDGRGALVVAPWRRDGHPDHEAAGRAAAAAALRTGARLLEYPIWFWHWGDPELAPWSSMVGLRLDDELRAAKARAVAEHRSQVAPLSAQPGDEVLLGPDVLAHFAHEQELFVREPVDDRALDTLHADDADPWGVETRWYERRKRALTLAALPRERFRSALEEGCSRGALATELATRCDSLLAVDSSVHAVQVAQARLAPRGPGVGNVDVEVADVAEDWPPGTFDLVVVSEVGYFLSPVALERVIEQVRSCLAPDGVVVLCHWRHPVDGWVLDGPTVHQRFVDANLRPVLSRHVEQDFELLVLAARDDWPDPHD